MLQPEILITAIDILHAAKIEYMLTGSVVSSLQGEPRSTHDIDILVNINFTFIPALLSAFQPPQYYISEDAIKDAIKFNSMFNVVDTTNGNKFDFWLVTGDAFDKSRFSRKQVELFNGVSMYVSTPEDTILMKLKWSIMSGNSEKQFNDALRVYELQYQLLDMQYLTKWVNYLNVDVIWKRLQSEANPIG